MNTIRWGMIGCGDVTEVKSGPGFYKADHSTLLAVTNRTLDKAYDYAQRHGVARVYPDATALLADPEIDAVYIATPPAGHKALTLQAAAAGKHVYVEKPMALNHAECEEMIAACKRAGVRRYVAFYRRAMPRFLKVKDWIEQGAIGGVGPGHAAGQVADDFPLRKERLDRRGVFQLQRAQGEARSAERWEGGHHPCP